MNKIKDKVVVLIKRSNFIQIVIRLTYRIASLLPIRKNTVVFESFLGKQYSDSPKAIYNFMQEHHKEYKMYWSFDRRVYNRFKNENLHSLSRLNLKWIIVMARAEYWVTNSRLPQWIPKRKGTTYIQTWHGTPLKKLGLDIEEIHMAGVTTQKYKRDFIAESNKWDYLLSANHYSTNIFTQAFNFKKEILEAGYPRNDVLFKQNNPADVQGIKEQLKIPFNKKVILYAPTWRDNDYHSIGMYKMNLQLDLSLMKNTLDNDYIILLRSHYLVADNLDLTGFEDFVFDYSHHDDISQLYLISDMLITDYSSVFFDYANLQRPILFFVYDIEEYRNELRGFYLDFEDIAPGPLVRTTEELVNEIKKIEQRDFEPSNTYKSFLERFCYLEDGQASKRVVEHIFKS